MIDTKDWTLEKVYQTVLNRQLGGVMLHSDARLFMAFLGLRNNSELHRLRQEDESKALDMVAMHYLDFYGFMLQAKLTDREEFISAEAYKTMAAEVGVEYKRKMLSRFMDLWHKWEKETAELYTAAVGWCLKMQEPDYSFFSMLLEQVQQEREHLRSIREGFSLAGYDLPKSEHILVAILDNC